MLHNFSPLCSIFILLKYFLAKSNKLKVFYLYGWNYSEMCMVEEYIAREKLADAASPRQSDCPA